MTGDVGVVRSRQARVPRAAQIKALTYVFVDFVACVGLEFIVEGGRPYAGESAGGEACMQVELQGALVVRFRETPIDVVGRGGHVAAERDGPGGWGMNEEHSDPGIEKSGVNWRSATQLDHYALGTGTKFRT